MFFSFRSGTKSTGKIAHIGYFQINFVEALHGVTPFSSYHITEYFPRQTKNAPLNFSGASLERREVEKRWISGGSRLPPDLHGYTVTGEYEKEITKMKTKCDEIVKGKISLEAVTFS